MENLFEDSGKIASGMTSVVHDKERNKFYMHGESQPVAVHLRVVDQSSSRCCGTVARSMRRRMKLYFSYIWNEIIWKYL